MSRPHPNARSTFHRFKLTMATPMTPSSARVGRWRQRYAPHGAAAIPPIITAIGSQGGKSEDSSVRSSPIVLVAATDIEADLGIPDVGFSGIDVGPRDLIYLANAFGTPGYLATRAIIALADAAGGRATASVYASEREILSVPSIRDMAGNALTQLGFINGGLAVHPITGEVFFTETDVRSPTTHTNGIIGVQRVTGMEPPPPPYRSRR